MAEVSYIGTGIVTAPVSLKSVADLLNSSGSGSTAKYDDGSVCMSSRVNPYSRRKPIRKSDMFTDDDDTIWKNANWGFWIPTSTALAVAKWMLGGTMPWTIPDEDYSVDLPGCGIWKYLMPRGKETYNEILRLGDFRGYNHNTGRDTAGSLSKARIFYGWVTGKDGAKQLPQTSVIECSKFSGAIFQLNSGIYSMSEFYSLSNKYFGVLVVDADSSTSAPTYHILTCEDVVSDTSNILTVTDSDFTQLFPNTKNYYVLPIISEYQAIAPTVQSGATIYVLPFAKYTMHRHLANAILDITVTATSYPATGTTTDYKTITFAITFKNTGYSDATNLSVTITYNGKDYSKSPTTTTVAMNGNLSYTATITPGGVVPATGSYTISYSYSDSETGGNGSTSGTFTRSSTPDPSV